MRDFGKRRLAALLGFVWVCGCGPTPASRPTTAPTEQRERTVFDELHALERPEPPLNALPAASREKLSAVVDSLGLEERSELQQGTHPQSSVHPLFHWAAGGNALAVYAASVETSALSADWTALAGSGETPPPPRELVDVGNELVRRAARHLLRERAADFSPGRTPSVEALRQVTAAADLLEMRELGDRVAALWSEADSSPEAQWAAFHRSLARLDVRGAEARLDALRRLPDEATKVATAELDVAAARLVSEKAGSALERARAAIRLGLYEQAITTLNESADPGLARTTELVRAELGASVCPAVLRPTESLCTAAFSLESTRLGLRQRLLDSWATNTGRDDVAVEHFLGLAFVWSLMTARSHDGTPLERRDFTEMLTGLSAHARTASAEFPRYEGIALIADALREAVFATEKVAHGERAQMPDDTRQRLRERALAKLNGDHPWFESAALTSLALSLQDDPIGPELSLLRVKGGEGLATQGSLELWTALADKDKERLRALNELLVGIARETEPHQRAGWLLAYAEAGVVLDPGASTEGTLLRLAEALLQDAALDLKLRAVLDTAGVWARTGREKEAFDLLSKTTGEVPFERVDSETARDLWVLLAGYREVLASRDANGLATATTAIDALRASTEQIGASPSVVTWVELWQAEFGKRARLAACKTQQCRRREVETDRALWTAVERRLGARTRALFEAGAVPLGGAEIHLSYDADRGLLPHVAIDVAFPLVEIPPREKAQLRR